MAGKRLILLVDFYNLFIRSFLVVPIQNEDGEHFGGVFGSLQSLKSAIDGLNPSEVYVISDGPNAALRRKKMCSDYKANRTREWHRGAVRAFDFLSEQEQSESFGMQVKRLREYFEVLPIKTIQIPYVEADDIIAEIANRSTDDTHCLIYSTDSDYKQLISERISCYNPITKKLMTQSAFFEKHGFLADNYIYLKMMAGDASDNVSGLKGIGEKTFVKLFPDVKDKPVKDLDELLEVARHSLDAGAAVFTPSVLAKYRLLLDSEEHLKLNWNLMQLQDVNISQQSRDSIQNLMAAQPNQFNRMRLRQMFLVDKLYGHVKYFDVWTRVFVNLAMRRIS